MFIFYFIVVVVFYCECLWVSLIFYKMLLFRFLFIVGINCV